MNWYEIENVSEIDSPALLVYEDRVRENIRLLKNMVNDDCSRLRPHVKTNKIAEVCTMMLRAGIEKFKCATIAEAEMLGICGAPDVLLSYQPVGPKVERLLRLIEAYPGTRFSCVVDHIGAALGISAAAVRHGQTVSLFIDLNTGMNRTGILPQHARELFHALRSLPSVRVAGLHCYDGHIRDTDPAARENSTSESLHPVLALQKELTSAYEGNMAIVAGGSPTFPIHAQNRFVECSPGTFVFWDFGYHRSFPDEPFVFAALVLTRVISIVNAHTITCDLGHKSVAAENPLPRVHFLNAEAVPLSQSEEHLVLDVPDASRYAPGDVLYAVPIHICPTVALYKTAMVIRDHLLAGEWQVIARDRRILV